MRRPISALVASALLCTLPARQGDAGEFKGRCEDSVLLGSERWPELKQNMRDLRALVKAGELGPAIELQRKIVRMQCHNHYQSYYLAELLVRAGQLPAALEVLDGLYDLGVNDMEIRLFNPKNHLHPVVKSEVFAGSELERKMTAKRAEVDARQAASRARLTALTAGQRPPDPYVAADVCPFECCTFGSWSVLEDTPLVASPGSQETVASARKGTRVEGLTGDVHMKPLPVSVVHTEPAYHPDTTVAEGEIVFLLDPIGEGMRHVWHGGVVRTMETSDDVKQRCPFPDEDCWGEHLLPASQRTEPTWWVKVRLPDGREGWTREPNFGDIDGCG
jgi:hypothetical protein